MSNKQLFEKLRKMRDMDEKAKAIVKAVYEERNPMNLNGSFEDYVGSVNTELLFESVRRALALTSKEEVEVIKKGGINVVSEYGDYDSNPLSIKRPTSDLSASKKEECLKEDCQSSFCDKCSSIIRPNPEEVKEREFKVVRLKNNKGDSHLLVITEKAIEDVEIGSVIIVPYAEGFKDPVKVLLQVDNDGKPKVANDRFAIVTKYIY